MSCSTATTTTYNLDITQGSDYSIRMRARDVNCNYINLSGYSARGYARHRYSSTGILINLQPQVHSSYVSGIVDVSLSGVQTAALPIVQGVYDVEIYDSGTSVLKILGGKFNVYPEATY